MAAVLPGWLRKLHLVRRNFRGHDVVTAGGLITSLGALPFLVLLYRTLSPSSFTVALMATVGGFAVLGLQDDVFGSSEAKGLRGHVLALLKRRRVTSGLIKAVGGLVWALIITTLLLHLQWPAWFLVGMNVALGANAGNLLDLRPGRAGAVTILCLFVAMVGLLLAHRRPDALAVACLITAALVVQYHDSRGWLMLGDTGSNLLGASGVLVLCLAFPSTTFAAALLAVLLGLHALTERYSLTELINRNPILRWLDGLTGMR